MIRTLKNSEIAILKLRALYESRGYQHFKMGKFEEYDIYAENKDFLAGESIITFTDTNGKLMALKPDVTMSIIKNFNGSSGAQKLYYNENVYRVCAGSHQLTELMQSGLECIGEIDLYNTCEVIALAAKSLKLFGEDYVLDISHMGIISALTDELNISHGTRRELLRCIGAKNIHGIREILGNCSDEIIKLLCLNTDPEIALSQLKSICSTPAAHSALSELEEIIRVLKTSEEYPHIRLDFSVVQDLTYYNGVVFQGFILGIPEKILTGGRYDLLMRKIGKNAGAIGFGVSIDPLERIFDSHDEFDADIAVIYDSKDDAATLAYVTDKLCREGNKVAVVRRIDGGAKYRSILRFNGKELISEK